MIVRALALLSLCASGCADLSWFIEQGVGQAEVLAAARPIAPLLADARTPPKVRQRLALAVAARRFAKDMGLDVGFQYRNVVFLDAPAVVYVVTAAPRTSLDPYMWTYPIVGALPWMTTVVTVVSPP